MRRTYFLADKGACPFWKGEVFENMTIIGPGLLGASLGAAAHGKGLVRRTVVWARRPEAREVCLSRDWCEEAFGGISDAVRESDFVVVCTPVRHIETILTELALVVCDDSLVTDVGSVKGSICQAAAAAFADTNATFIGSHPMAGSDKAGMDHARGNLFENRPCFVTPETNAPSDLIQKLNSFWQKLGMTVTTASPAEHDEVVAHVSHLPHAVASAVCHLLAQRSSEWSNLAGQGLQDTTRVAAGDPVLWEEIFGQNRDALLSALESFEKTCGQLREALGERRDDEIRNWLAAGKKYRDELN